MRRRPTASALAGARGELPRLRPDCPAVPDTGACTAHWGPPPAAPAGLAERILAAVAEPDTASIAPCHRHLAGSTVLAGRLADGHRSRRNRGRDHRRSALEAGDRTGPTNAAWPRGRHDPRRRSAIPTAAGGQMLNEAVADATDATWDLARSASEPAARISRQVLDAATEPRAAHRPSPALGGGPSRIGHGPVARCACSPTRPPPWPRSSRSATVLPPVSAALRRRPVTRSASCSGQLVPKPEVRVKLARRKGA